MWKMFTVIALTIGLGACVSTSGGSPYAETGAICDNAGLESQLVGIQDRSKSVNAALGLGTGDGGGIGGVAYSNNDVQRAYRLRDKLNRFDAQVDVQFRTLTASCKAYSRCMEMRNYREGECRSSLARWQDAERSFTSLTRELAEIDADVKRLSLVTKQSKGKGSDRARLNPRDPCKRCENNSVGGVFSNGCC